MRTANLLKVLGSGFLDLFLVGLGFASTAGYAFASPGISNPPLTRASGRGILYLFLSRGKSAAGKPPTPYPQDLPQAQIFYFFPFIN
jgi:hypothetical protein